MRRLVFNADRTPRPAFTRVVFKKSGAVRPAFQTWVLPGGAATRSSDVPTAANWLEARWRAQQAIACFSETENDQRVNIVTDSIQQNSLFGGVGTSLILGTVIANRLGADLRIITRTAKPDHTAYGSISRAAKLTPARNVSFAYAPIDGHNEIAVGPKDLFLSTSWWTTRSLLNTVPASRIVYLLQEDERMFYPMGDEWLECDRTLRQPDILTIINTALLRDHFLQGPNAIPELAARSVAFEPAFSRGDGIQDGLARSQKRRLFFYARPSNVRNLYATGLSALVKAVESGTLRSSDWELHFSGTSIPRLSFPNDIKVVYHAPKPWEEYLGLMKSMDAGFVLMFTPHPSYPPLDLAAMGKPVLTNRFGLKQDLSGYSKNIICADPAPDALAAAFADLVQLADNRQMLDENLKADHLQSDWTAALDSAVSAAVRHWTERT